MAIFNSYVKLPEGNHNRILLENDIIHIQHSPLGMKLLINHGIWGQTNLFLSGCLGFLESAKSMLCL